MTTFRTTHKRIVRYYHDNGEPGQPSNDDEFLRKTGPDVLTASPDRKETDYLFDPLTTVTPPADPPAYTGNIYRNEDYWIVRLHHDGSPPSEPVVNALYLPALRHTKVLSVSPDRKITDYYYNPNQPQGQSFFLQLETGDYLLTEDGDRIILE